MSHASSVIRTVFLLMPAVLIPAMSMDVYVPSVPRMMTLLHTSSAKVQWTLSIFMLGMSIGQLLIGPLADRLGRKPTVIASIILYLFSTYVCALAATVEQLIIARFFQAVSACGCIVPVWAMVRDLYEEENAAAVYSYLNGAIGVAPILAPILGGYLLYWSDTWRAGFFFLGFWALGVLSIVLALWQETLSERKHLALNQETFAHYREILCHSDFLRYTFGGAMGMSALFLYFSISPVLLIERLNVAEHHFGYYFGAVASIFLLFNLISPQLQQRLGNANMLWLSSLFFILGPILMVVFHAQYGLTTMGVVLPTLLLYVGVGLIFGPCTSGALAPFGRMAGTAAALYGFLQFGWPSLLGVLLMRQGVESMLSFAYVMLGQGILMFLWCAWARRSQKKR